MPSFDVVSRVDMQEVRNAVDQAQREISTRFDFRNTDSRVELHDDEIRLASATEDRLKAVLQVLEEKLVRRKISLKAIDVGKVEEASKGTARQSAKVKSGLSSDNAKTVNKLIKEKAPKGVSSQTQGDQVRVTGKKRDQLQDVIAELKAADLDVPLQFENFRD